MKTREEVQHSFDNLRELTDELYINNPTGGPLHITTDDGNIDDGSLVFCYRELFNSDHSVLTQSICKAILHELMMMTEPQRVIWWIEKSIEEDGSD
jgi:hypothetical protein